MYVSHTAMLAAGIGIALPCAIPTSSLRSKLARPAAFLHPCRGYTGKTPRRQSFAFYRFHTAFPASYENCTERTVFNPSFPYGKHRMPERTGQTPRVRRLARRRYRNCTSVRNSDLEFAPQTRLLTAFPTSCRNNICNSGGGRGRKKTALNGVFSPPKRNFGFFKGVKVGRTPIEEKGTSSFLRKQKYSKPKNVQDVHSWAPFPFCSCFCTVCAYN